MDKKSKVIVVALIVTGVVFAFGLGSTLVPKKDEDKGPGGYQSGWLKGMDNLLGRFSPQLDRGRLPLDTACKEQPGKPDSAYKLTSNTACNIDISGAGDDYQTATLLVSNATNILVPCPEQESSATERGMLARIKITNGDAGKTTRRGPPGGRNTQGHLYATGQNSAKARVYGER